jgi:putative ribosome biogenesis GTPase RsgA
MNASNVYFREEDAAFFFGREIAADRLRDALARRSLIAVVGASGSGKSSVVRAGLLPRLRRESDPVGEESRSVVKRLTDERLLVTAPRAAASGPLVESPGDRSATSPAQPVETSANTSAGA